MTTLQSFQRGGDALHGGIGGCLVGRLGQQRVGGGRVQIDLLLHAGQRCVGHVGRDEGPARPAVGRDPLDLARMQLGVDGVFVGSGIFKSGDPVKRAKAIVEATTFYNDPVKLAEISEDLGEAMVGIEIDTLDKNERLASRGW